jgi:hypothetical protein
MRVLAVDYWAKATEAASVVLDKTKPRTIQALADQLRA